MADTKEFIEEYGGILLACFMGMLLLGILTGLTDSQGGLYQLAKIFAESIGSMQAAANSLACVR